MVAQQIQILQKAIREMKEQRKQWISDSEQEMKFRYNTMMKLMHFGILKMEDITESSVRWGVSKDIKREDLIKVRKAVGRVSVSGKSLHMENNKVSETQIRVTICPVECPDVHLTYVRELSEGAKCKIKKIVIPPVPEREEFALVCAKDQ